MRCFAWLVAFCLLAGGVARAPAARTLDRHKASVEDASDLASLVPRRPSAFTTEKRAGRGLDIASTPVIAAPGDRPRMQLATSVTRSTCVIDTRGSAHGPRGPPAPRSFASNHPSS